MGDLPSSSTAMGPPRARPGRRWGTAQSSSDSYAPLSAEGYFEEALQVDIEGEGSWRVYRTPPRSATNSSTTHQAPAPTASGSTPTDAALASLDLSDVPSDEDEDPKTPGTMFLFHHGAGFSALSFALAAREITQQTNSTVGVMALDCRGHGRTTHPPSTPLPLDMSLDRLVTDAVAVLEKLYNARTMPTLILVGHSMGGSVVVSLVEALQSRGAKVAGVAVLDVVEGTALDALSGMRGIVASQPSGFDNIQEAIRWHVDSGAVQNLQSARVSVPSLLVRNPDYEGPVEESTQDEPMEELQEPSTPTATSPTPHAYTWRANLLSTEPYWRGWFTDLSKRFLTARTARLLVLAGTDRLDKDLMVGQMQGKYQLAVFHDVGHNLHEDSPERTARLLVEFWTRNEVGLRGVRVKKVGEA